MPPDEKRRTGRCRSKRADSLGVAVATLLLLSVGCSAGLGAGSEASVSAPSPTSPVVETVPDSTGPTTTTPSTSSSTVTSAAVIDSSVESSARETVPVVIGHRGASAERPENTLGAFALAIELGADFVEPDVVMTRDGHAIVRHEHQLDFTTNVADVPELAGKRSTKTIDGEVLTGWFVEDLTLDEIKMLRAVERNPDIRPQSARFDGEEEIPTFREVLELVVSTNERESLDVGIYPEIKLPSYFSSLGLDAADAVVSDLEEFGFVSEDDNAIIQSFEVETLRALDAVTDLTLVQLFAPSGSPRDQLNGQPGLTYAAMATREGLEDVSKYADGVGVEKNAYIIPLDDSGALDEGRATAFVADAHDAGLFVHAYTFRAENEFLPIDFRTKGPPSERGDLVGEVSAFLRAGVDGIFIDQVELGREAVQRS